MGTRPYLIGPDTLTLDAVAGHVFPSAVDGVERLDGAEPTRLSALLIQKDIPQVGKIGMQRRMGDVEGRARA